MTFQLRADSDIEAFLEIDARVQTEVPYQCEGLRRRTIARNDDRWLVLQTWDSREQCGVGRTAFEASESGRQFLEFVDGSMLSVASFGDVA